MASLSSLSGAGPSTGVSINSTNRQLMPSFSNPGDVAVWLHNKLSSDEIWSDKNSIVSHLNAEILRHIKSCFSELQLNVKLKLLLSFLHIAKRNLDEWKHELDDLIEIAINDSDPWVSVVGELLENFPREGTIDIDPSSSSFADLGNELKKLVKKQDQKILPLECLFLNRNAFTNSFGQMPQPTKHFQLKRKAKSAAIRAEFLQKATDLSSGKRASSGAPVPIRCRGFNNDQTPLKGIPSRNHYSSYSSFGKSSGPSALSRSTPAGTSRAARIASMVSSMSGGGSGGGIKRDGGIVLLDINEAPSASNPRETKRQRKSEKANTTSTSTTTTTTGSTTTATSSSPVVASKMTPASTSIEQENKDPVSGLKSPPANFLQSKTSPVLGHKTGSVDSAQAKRFDNETDESAQNSIQNRTVFASKSTPDYAAGLLGSSATTNQAKLQPDGAIQTSMGHSSAPQPPGPSSTAGPASMYHQTQAQQSQIQSQSQSSPSMFANKTFPQQVSNSTMSDGNQSQRTQTIIRTPSANFTLLNQSLANQQQQQAQKSPMIPNYASSQQQQPQQTQQAPQQHTLKPNYGEQYQNQTQQNSSPQKSLFQQQFMNQQPQQQVNNIRHSPLLANQLQQPQAQHQPFQASFGLYGDAPPQQPQNLPQQQPPPAPPQQQQVRPVAPPAQPQTRISADMLKDEIRNLYPQLNNSYRSMILNFLDGRPNPTPHLGPEQTFRLGETIQFRPKPDGSTTRVVIETSLLIDYDKKVCKKIEHIKSSGPGPMAIRAAAPPNSGTPQQQNFISGARMMAIPRAPLAMMGQPGPGQPGQPRMALVLTPSGQLQQINPALLQQPIHFQPQPQGQQHQTAQQFRQL